MLFCVSKNIGKGLLQISRPAVYLGVCHEDVRVVLPGLFVLGDVRKYPPVLQVRGAARDVLDSMGAHNHL